MKKLTNIVIGICTLLCFIASADTDIINDWTRNSLKGKVKTCIYTRENKEFDGKVTKSVYTDRFDNKGNWLERQIYRSDGIAKEKVTFTYDSKTNSHNVNHYNEKGELFIKETFRYDDRGNWLEDFGYYVKDGSFEHKSTYKYNAKNYLIISNGYDSQGNLDYQIISKNDDNGNPIEESTYNNDGSLFMKEIIKYISYDKQGNWTERHHLPTKDNVTKSVVKRQFTYYQ